MMEIEPVNGRAIGDYIAECGSREFPETVRNAGRMCLADWLGVAIGAADEGAARIVREVMGTWQSSGRATVLFGNSAAAPIAALCNGTLAHCLDFDDTHTKSLAHMSAPVWAATLALGEEVGADESEMLAAFITGFEVGTKLGLGLGDAVTERGWHSTGVFGRLGAAAASAALLRLDGEQALRALGAAATQTSGLVASFGTMSKPFHAGKAAMDGVLSAQLGRAGFASKEKLIEPGGGLDGALIQDGSLRIPPVEFTSWEVLNNSFKPYAACHQTHAAIDAAREVREALIRTEDIQSIEVFVAPLARTVTGGKNGMPKSPLEGKFDVKFCIAQALHGAELTANDFREPWNIDERVFATARKVKVAVEPSYGIASARLVVVFGDGRKIEVSIPVAKGHPGNPMSWEDMGDKFQGLTRPRLGDRTLDVFHAVRNFGNGETLSLIRGLASAEVASEV